MPDEKALEYTVTNTDKRATPTYRITNTYITDPSRNTLLIRTRFQSLDGNGYRLYLLENPSMAGGGANDNAWWDGTNLALMSDQRALRMPGSCLTVMPSEVVDPAGVVSRGGIAPDAVRSSLGGGVPLYPLRMISLSPPLWSR